MSEAPQTHRAAVEERVAIALAQCAALTEEIAADEARGHHDPALWAKRRDALKTRRFYENQLKFYEESADA